MKNKIILLIFSSAIIFFGLGIQKSSAACNTSADCASGQTCTGGNCVLSSHCTPGSASGCASGQTCGPDGNCVAPGQAGAPNMGTTFTNPLTFNTVEELLSHVMDALRGGIVMFSIIFIILGAQQYITSAGNSEKIETAKKSVTAAIVGLAIGLAAPALLKTIGQLIGWGGVNNSQVSDAPDLLQILFNVLNFLLSITGIIALVMLVIGAIMYLTSAGDEDRIDTGKNIFKYSLLGVIIAMASNVLVHEIAKFFASSTTR